MSPDTTTQTADAEDNTFSASDYFLGIAQRIMASGKNTRVSLPGKGEVTLFPRRKLYYTTLADMTEFCLAPSAKFEISELQDEAAPRGKNIADLLWQAAFHASQGRLLNDCSKFDIVQFNHWPNLPHLPKTPNTMRICAMLTRYPTSIMLAHRRLKIEKDELYRVYCAAYCAGIATIRNLASTVQLRAADIDSAESDEIAEEAGKTKNQGLFRSMFAKISGL